MVILRPYQEKAKLGMREAFKTNRAVLYCLPCGGGKGTLTAAMVHGAVQRKKSVIFAVKGRALVNDMSRRVTKIGVEHGVLMSGKRRERWHPVQVASIDTLHRMAQKPPADIIIVDEARTFLSATARMALDDYPNAKIVGLDATPIGPNGKGLGVDSGGLFDVMIMGPNEQELIDMGFLVPSIPIGIENPPDVSNVDTPNGEFNNKQLAVACKSATRVGDIVEHWLREAFGRKTVAFGIDRADAMDITNQFLAAGVKWTYVDANTPDEERQRIWDDLDFGDLMGFSNVGIAGCGWDHPIVSCVISGAPRNSLAAWRQEIGRGSRIHPESGKKNFIILDHAGNLMRHYPVGFFEVPPIWSLNGRKGKSADEENAPPVSTCKIPILVPESGRLPSFTGPLSSDGKYMLPGFHTFKSGPTECPYCGIPLSTGEGRAVEVEAGQLTDLSALREEAKVEVQKSAKRLEYEDKLRTRYLELIDIGRGKLKKDGTPWSPKWATIAFKHEFGRWPEKAWAVR